jgi:hypothetical protein
VVGCVITALGILLYWQLARFTFSSMVMLSAVVILSFAATLGGMAVVLAGCLIWARQASKSQVLITILLFAIAAAVLAPLVNIHSWAAILITVVPIAVLAVAWLSVILLSR